MTHPPVLTRHPKDGRCHFSELKAMRESPLHYLDACASARTVTRPMTVGSVADCMVFGNRGHVIYPGKVRNGKEWEAFKAAHADEVICIQSEADDAAGAAEAVKSHADAQSILSRCDFQVCHEWERDGIECAAGIRGERGGFDAIDHGRREIWDLKITSSVDEEWLMRHLRSMLWHVQGAWYVDGAESTWRGRWSFGLIVVESSPPHDIAIVEVTPAMLDQGRKSIRFWTERLRQCELTGHWPGRHQRRLTCDVEEWDQ